jgi:hypothetical protein
MLREAITPRSIVSEAAIRETDRCASIRRQRCRVRGRTLLLRQGEHLAGQGGLLWALAKNA